MVYGLFCSYYIQSGLAQFQMQVVSDIQEVFVPLLDGFLVKLSESEGLIERYGHCALIESSLHSYPFAAFLVKFQSFLPRAARRRLCWVQ
jgi:hypothetical protein